VKEAQPGRVEEGDFDEVDDDERSGGSAQMFGERRTGRCVQLSPRRYDTASIKVVRINDKFFHLVRLR
jgi:hypothetical protein